MSLPLMTDNFASWLEGCFRPPGGTHPLQDCKPPGISLVGDTSDIPTVSPVPSRQDCRPKVLAENNASGAEIRKQVSAPAACTAVIRSRSLPEDMVGGSSSTVKQPQGDSEFESQLPLAFNLPLSNDDGVVVTQPATGDGNPIPHYNRKDNDYEALQIN